jgi:hypothetical protein
VPVVTVRTLAHEFRIRSQATEALSIFRFAEATPEMPGEALTAVDLEIERTGSFFLMALPGGGVVEGSLDYLLSAFQLALWSLNKEEITDSPALSAATVTRGQRGLLVGDAGFGKTTLVLRLIGEGFAIEGDELAVVGQGWTIALPRRLRVRRESLRWVPHLAAEIETAPAIRDWDGRTIYSIDPGLGRRAWRIERGPVDHLIFIEPNHGGSSVMGALTADQAFTRLIDKAYMPPSGKAAAAASLRLLALGGHSWKLQLGDLDRALWHLNRHFDGLPKT